MDMHMHNTQSNCDDLHPRCPTEVQVQAQVSAANSAGIQHRWQGQALGFWAVTCHGPSTQPMPAAACRVLNAESSG